VSPSPFLRLSRNEPREQTAISRQAVSALRSEDFEGLDRLLDWAIAEGCSIAAAERIRGLGQLLRGDAAAALRCFTLAKDREVSDARGTTKGRLLEALISLQKGSSWDAIRKALTALAIARKNLDGKGERASLLALSHFLRLFGREVDASKIERVAN